MGHYSEACEYYDVLYSELKDYEAEIRLLLEVVQTSPEPRRRILDVGCGTGRHAELLNNAGFAVDGLDLEPGFISIAKKRNPGHRFWVGDMTSFEVTERYDVVLCLFSSIGYTVDEANLRAAFSCFREAVRDGGLVVVEPWFEPGDLAECSVHMHAAQNDDLHVCRIARSEVVGNVSRHQFEYLIGRASGIERLSEVHELGLFTRSAMIAAFEDTGFEVKYDPEGLTGRGLYIASKR